MPHFDSSDYPGQAVVVALIQRLSKQIQNKETERHKKPPSSEFDYKDYSLWRFRFSIMHQLLLIALFVLACWFLIISVRSWKCRGMKPIKGSLNCRKVRINYSFSSPACLDSGLWARRRRLMHRITMNIKFWDYYFNFRFCLNICH